MNALAMSYQEDDISKNALNRFTQQSKPTGEIKIRVNVAHQNIQDKLEETDRMMNKLITMKANMMKEPKDLVGPPMMKAGDDETPIGRFTGPY